MLKGNLLLKTRNSKQKASHGCTSCKQNTVTQPFLSEHSSNILGLQHRTLPLNACTMYSVMSERASLLPLYSGCSPALDEALGNYWLLSIEPKRQMPWMTTVLWYNRAFFLILFLLFVSPSFQPCSDQTSLIPAFANLIPIQLKLVAIHAWHMNESG